MPDKDPFDQSGPEWYEEKSFNESRPSASFIPGITLLSVIALILAIIFFT